MTQDGYFYDNFGLQMKEIGYSIFFTVGEYLDRSDMNIILFCSSHKLFLKCKEYVNVQFALCMMDHKFIIITSY